MRVVPVVVVAVFVLFLGVMMPAAPVFIVVVSVAMLTVLSVMVVAVSVFFILDDDVRNNRVRGGRAPRRGDARNARPLRLRDGDVRNSNASARP